MKRLHHLRVLLKKEMLQLVKDPKMKVTIFGPPVWMLILFGYAATMDLKDCPFAVLDQAHTSETRQLIAKLEHSQVFVRKPDFRDEKDMKKRMSEKDVKMGVVFPPDFTHRRQVEVVTDGRNTSSAGMATGYALDDLSACDIDLFRPKYYIRGWFNPDYDARWFAAPCLLANLILITLTMLVALSLAREREAGTMDQLHLTPYTPFETLLAKGFSGVLVGAVQALTALAMILWWFWIPFTGDPWALAVLILSFLVMAVGLGLLISVYSNTLQQAMIVTMVIAMPLTMLSGITCPVSCMPTVFQWFADVNPVRYAIDALQQVFLEGGGFQALAVPIFILTLGGILFFFLAWNKFRKL